MCGCPCACAAATSTTESGELLDTEVPRKVVSEVRVVVVLRTGLDRPLGHEHDQL